jgi:starvation-inducible outer membrane lipoprotein
MTNFTKASFCISAILLLTGCASSNHQSRVPDQITIAPAIDVTYDDVIKNVPNHVCVNVRWGGQIIGVEDAGSPTRLTVLAYPLNRKGQPNNQRGEDFVGGRFIIETTAFDSEKNNRFVTVYGRISDKEVLKNGHLTQTIPVVTAIESKEWTEHDRRYARDRIRLPYNGLGFGLGVRVGPARIAFNNYDYYGRTNLHPFFDPYYFYRSKKYNRRRNH